MSIEVPGRLSHLRTDRRGIPVPYINLWGTEDPERADVRRDPHIGMTGVFYDDSGETVPDFTRQNMGRQRECMALGLCQVCARTVPWSRRCLVIADLSQEVIEFDGLRAVVVEPWLCRRCAEYAVQYCPALIRRTREEALRIVAVPASRYTKMVLSTGWIGGRWEERTKAEPVAIWAKLLLDPRVLGLPSNR